MQQTLQIPNNLLQEILGNVSTMICFNVSHADAAKLSREFVLHMGAESEHMPPDFLLKLRVGEAWGKIGSSVFPLKTPLADQRPNMARAKEIIERSRTNYALAASKDAWPSSPKKRPFVVVPDEDSLDPEQVF
jgi:hypothetical protein